MVLITLKITREKIQVENQNHVPEIGWLQPRALSAEEISRLARAQAYAARVTEEKSSEEINDAASPQPSGTVEKVSKDYYSVINAIVIVPN